MIKRILSILIALSGVVSGINPPKTTVTLNAEKGCAVHIAAWFSPSCIHCKNYFLEVLPKITAKPGFCIDFHVMPHMSPLDLPIAVLIWSQGPENAIKNAKLFYSKQDEWFTKSEKFADTKDPKRKEDIEEFLNTIANTSTKDEIKNYLTPEDPYLYVKIFALTNGFSIKHLKQYFPRGGIDFSLSAALLKDLPRKTLANGDRPVVNYSPAFTTPEGEFLPNDQLYNGILTESAADDMLKNHPFVPKPQPIAQSSPALEAPNKTHYVGKKQEDLILDDDDVQDADEEENNQDESQSNEEDEASEENGQEYEHTTALSKRLQTIIEQQIKEDSEDSEESVPVAD